MDWEDEFDLEPGYFEDASESDVWVDSSDEEEEVYDHSYEPDPELPDSPYCSSSQVHRQVDSWLGNNEDSDSDDYVCSRGSPEVIKLSQATKNHLGRGPSDQRPTTGSSTSNHPREYPPRSRRETTVMPSYDQTTSYHRHLGQRSGYEHFDRFYGYTGNQHPRKCPPRSQFTPTAMSTQRQATSFPKEPTRHWHHSGYKHFDRIYGYTGNQHPSKCPPRSQFASSTINAQRPATSFTKEPTRTSSPSKEAASRLSHDLPKVKLAAPELLTPGEAMARVKAYIQYWKDHPHQPKCQTSVPSHVPGQEDMKEEVQPGPYQANSTTRTRKGGCYKCQDPSHYARDCPSHPKGSPPGMDHQSAIVVVKDPREEKLSNPSFVRPVNLGFRIHPQIMYCGDNDRARIGLQGLPSSLLHKAPPGTDHHGLTSSIRQSTRAVGPSFNTHRQVTYFEDLGRARTRPGGLPSCLVHDPSTRMRQEPWELSMEAFGRSFLLSFGIHRETMNFEHLGQAIMYQACLPKGLVHEPLCGSNEGTWEFHTADPARSFDLGVIIRPQSGHGKVFDRGKICLERPEMRVGSQVPHIAVIGHHGLTKPLGQGSYGSSDSVLFPSFDLKHLLHLGVSGTVPPPANPCTKADAIQGYPVINLCICGTSQTFVWHPGGSPLQLELAEGIQWCFPVSNTTRNQAHPCSPHRIQHEEVLRFMLVANACMHPASLGSRFCCTNTYTEVFDRGKLSLDRPVLRDSQRGPLPSYTDRADTPKPPGRWDHYPCLFGHVHMDYTRPLEASASTPTCAASPGPRTTPFDLTGEVILFSLKLLLFPFDPGTSLENVPYRCC